MAHPQQHMQMNPAGMPLGQIPQTAPQQPPPPEVKYDNIARVRTLTWSLSEHLSNLAKLCAHHINYNASLDQGGKAMEEPMRLDKMAEDFASICNQIELSLKTIQECSQLQKASNQYLGLPVQLIKQDTGMPPTQDCLSYIQYLSTVKAQVAFWRQLHDLLVEGSQLKIGAPQSNVVQQQQHPPE